MVHIFVCATFVGSSSLISIKFFSSCFKIGMKQRFTGTQYENLFIITYMTVVRDGLGTNQKWGARNVSTFLLL